MEVEQAVAEKSEITSENLKLEPESQEENNLEGNDATNLNNEQNGQASNKNPAHDALAGEADIKMEVVEQEIREDTLEDALAKGRKRKASENKSEGESSLEDHKKFIKEEIKTDDELKNEADSLNAATDLNFLPGQTLGKGKRARIPNKRYSDINLTRRSLSKTENGTESESEAPKEIKEEVLPPVQPEPLYSPSISSNRRGKVIVDMSNPNFLKPFKYGWRRELVYRAQSDECPVKQFGDIYYYTPEGKKLKSLREITENLKDKRLSIDDFTFYKEPIGLKDTSKEVIRDAKFKYVQGRKVYAALPKKSLSPNLKPTMVSKLESTPEVIKSKPSKKFGNIKVKLSMKPKSDRKHSKSVEKPIEEVSRSHKKASNPKYPDGGATASGKQPNIQPCSITCQSASGLIPALQCRTCLCLYHYECMGLSSSLPIYDYLCKNCVPEDVPNIEATPTTSDTPTELVNPKATLQTMSKIVKLPNAHVHATLANENKSLLGSVTSWLPQNSKIHVEENALEPIEAKCPQCVEYLAGRKFLIIPKHNIVSVSPNMPLSRVNSTDMDVVESAPTGSAASLESIAEGTPSPPEHSRTEFQQMEGIGSQDTLDVAEPPKKMPVKVNSVATKQPVQESRFMENYLQNVSYGYKTLLNVFQYLKVQDLVRAGCVCHMWRDIANHHLLWRTVRMKNSQVHSFEGLTNTLEKHGTVQLDLRKMLLTTVDDIWPEFSQNIGKVSTLRKIELCRCPAAVVESLTDSNTSLEILNALTIRCEKLDLSGFSQLINLRELRLKSTAGLTITSTLESLKNLKHLKHLSLTSVRDLHTLKLDVLAELKNLESLDLGECSDISEQFGTKILSKLTKLERLRLEKGQGTCHTFEILAAVKNMPHLEQLELVNFDIKPGFDKAMGACKNVKKLLIIPTYISQSATTNHMVLGGVLRLHKTLTHFVWGVTLELLRVTELFVDQCEEPDKKEKKEKKAPGSGDSIPVLKPIPLINDSKAEILPALDPPQVEILPLPNLQKLLLQSLPLTRVKILKIPFHATWRQSITDSVN